MLNSLVEFITVSSILISLQLNIGLSEEADSRYCTHILRKESILRWSEDSQNFVVSPLSSEDASIPDELPTFSELPENKDWKTKQSGSNMICIRAPINYHIELTLSLNSHSEHDPSYYESCYKKPKCNTSCLAISDQRDNSPYIKNKTLPLMIINLADSKGRNSSAIEDNIERFPRHSFQSISKRNDTKRTRRPRKCKNCRKSVNRWRRQKKRERKLVGLLLKYHNFFLKTDAQYREKLLIDNTDLPVTENLKAPSALRKLRERLNSFDLSGNRKPQPQNNQTYLPNRSGSRTTANVSSLKDKNKRRQKREAFAVNATRFGGNASSTPAFQQILPRLTLCGIDAFWNTSKGEGTRHVISKERFVNSSLVRAMRQQNINLTENGSESISTDEWISLEQPLQIASRGQDLNLYDVEPPTSDNSLLRFFDVKISFVLNERKRGTGEAIFTSHSQQPILNFISTARTIEVTSEAESQQNTSNLLYSENTTVGSNGENMNIIMGVVVGILLITATAFIYIFIKHRRNVARQFRKRCACFADVESPEVYHYKKKKKRRRNRNNQSDLTEESEVTMLEHEKQKRSVSSRKNAVRGGLNNSKQQASQKCKHYHVAKGTSKHTFCILCQTAEKPHQPVTTVQHASEFLPPASRQPNIGYSATLPSFQNNFDKFNRMLNNPYRYSPSLPVRHATLPSTVNLPDGEEVCKGQDQKPLMSADNTNGKGGDTNYIKSPPNRTIFESEALPWGLSNIHRKVRKANGYPGPPSTGSKHVSRHHHENSRTHTVKITEDGQLNYEHESSNGSDRCVCKCRLNHMGELPPDYSDVIREDTPLRDHVTTDSVTVGGCSATCNKDGLNNNINNNKSPSAKAKRIEKTFLVKRESSQSIDKGKSRGT